MSEADVKISRREQILQALVHMLESNPGGKITTANIAKTVGVSEAALYRHFPSKAKMFEGLIEYIEETIFSRTSRILQDYEEAEVRCEKTIMLVLSFAEKNPGMCRLLAGDALVGETDRLRQRIHQFFERLETQLKQILREAELREQYGQKLQGYQSKKASLGAKDFDEAEEVVLEGLSVQQQSVIIANSEKPELVVYALGKNPKVMERLASKKDLISFAFELAKLENNLKVTGTAKPKPEKRIKGAKGAALTSDKKLAQLEAEAERTGDMTKLIRYKKELRNRKANK